MNNISLGDFTSRFSSSWRCTRAKDKPSATLTKSQKGETHPPYGNHFTHDGTAKYCSVRKKPPTPHSHVASQTFSAPPIELQRRPQVEVEVVTHASTKWLNIEHDMEGEQEGMPQMLSLVRSWQRHTCQQLYKHATEWTTSKKWALGHPQMCLKNPL